MFKVGMSWANQDIALKLVLLLTDGESVKNLRNALQHSCLDDSETSSLVGLGENHSETKPEGKKLSEGYWAIKAIVKMLVNGKLC